MDKDKVMDKKRQARPMGITEIGHMYNKGIVTKEELEDKLIEHYIRTGFMFNGRSMSIEQFCIHTKIDPDRVFHQVTERGKDRFGMVDQEEQGDHLRALLGIAISGALSDRSAALQQLNILQSAQGQTYKPFVSGEVNKALKLTMESTQGILQIAKSLGGTQGLNVVINNNQGDSNTQHNYLTSDKALELMGDKDKGPRLINNQRDKDALFAKHNIQGMPEVKATKQRGMDTSKEGLAFDKLAELSDDKVDKKDHHRTRREEALEIDPEDDSI